MDSFPIIHYVFRRVETIYWMTWNISSRWQPSPENITRTSYVLFHLWMPVNCISTQLIWFLFFGRNEKWKSNAFNFVLLFFGIFLLSSDSFIDSHQLIPYANSQWAIWNRKWISRRWKQRWIINRGAKRHTRARGQATDELTMNVVVHFYRLFFVGILITKHFKFAEYSSSSSFDKRPKRKWANYSRLCGIEQGQGFDLLLSPSPPQPSSCNGIYLAIMVLLNDRQWVQAHHLEGILCECHRFRFSVSFIILLLLILPWSAGRSISCCQCQKTMLVCQWECVIVTFMASPS